MPDETTDVKKDLFLAHSLSIQSVMTGKARCLEEFVAVTIGACLL